MRAQSLTARPTARSTDRLAGKRILYATDFSKTASASLEFAVALAVGAEAEVRVLHVCPSRVGPEPLTGRLATRPARAHRGV